MLNKKQANIVCVLQRVSRQALNEFTDASNNLSDNIASLEHGKPILKPHAACFFFIEYIFSQSLLMQHEKTSKLIGKNWVQDERRGKKESCR